jgi:uncharacterized lipoprotein
MKKLIQSTSFILLAIFLTACSSLSSNNESQYRRDKTTQALYVPSGLSAKKMGDRYPVPAARENKPVNEVSLIPPGTA